MIRLNPKEKSRGLKKSPLKRKPFKRKIPKNHISTLQGIDPDGNKTWTKIALAVDEYFDKPLKKSRRLKIRRDSLDELFSLYIRTRDNFTCQRCGVKSKNVQCAHFIGRRNQNCRFLELNATTLCFGCHGFFHANPLIFVEWTKKRLGEREFNLLLAQERVILKPDRKALTLYYQAKIKELET
jgi:hypothetical protein